MGFFRFRRSFPLVPGVRLNLRKNSASVSLGGRGAHVTFGGPRGTRTTVGLPGTGLSYTEVQRHQAAARLPKRVTVATPGEAGASWPWVVLAVATLLGVWWVAYAITG